MAPAHQWAQSGDELFVSVKFAHKWDAPATLVGENDVESVEFAEELVTVRARKGSKRFDLEIVPLGRSLLKTRPGSPRLWVDSHSH